jgi:chemotaxis protein CheX
VKASKEAVFARGTDQISGDISAIMPMNSERFLGSMAIAFEEMCFLGIVEQMLGEVFTEITPDIQDAAGEICKQVFGMSKKILNSNGHTIQSALPTVIAGKGHSIKHTVSGVCIAVKFNCTYGNFVVEAVLQPK